jgi:glycosyltransferase involved in cell wall biosynthesis
MRILHLNDTSRVVGGVEVYLQDLFAGLAERGVSATLGHGSGDGTEFATTRRLPFLSEAVLVPRRDEAYSRMSHTLSELKPSAVHVHNIQNINAIAACVDAVPTFLHLHDYRYVCPASNFYYRASGTSCPLSPGVHCLWHAAVSRCLTPRPHVALRYLQRVRWVIANSHRFAGIFTNSNHVRDRLCAAGVAPGSVEVLHYFCSFNVPDAPASPQSPPYVLFVGRFREYKGVGDFIECVARLSNGVRGVMIGDVTPETSESVYKKAEALGCRGRLELRAWTSRPDIRDAIAHASLTVFPSIWDEPFGLVGLESQTLGVPVVAYDTGGIRDWLIDGVTGYCVPTRDVAGLATAAERVLQNPDVRAEMAVNGMQQTTSRFTRAGHLSRLLARYQTACCLA